MARDGEGFGVGAATGTFFPVSMRPILMLPAREELWLALGGRGGEVGLEGERNEAGRDILMVA